MRRSKILTSIGAAIIIVGITTSLTWFALHEQSKKLAGNSITASPIYQASSKEEEQQSGAPGLPLRLMIPKINVNAGIENMGVTAQGDMDSPDGPDNAGWYKLGPRPGEIGSAVMDGHFGWKNSKPAVFDKLHTLRKGDLVLVEDEAKQTYTFVVREVRSFAPDDDATEVFQSTDNLSHLNLITCQGIWNKDLESYTTRLVVFADLQP